MLDWTLPQKGLRKTFRAPGLSDSLPAALNFLSPTTCLGVPLSLNKKIENVLPKSEWLHPAVPSSLATTQNSRSDLIWAWELGLATLLFFPSTKSRSCIHHECGCSACDLPPKTTHVRCHASGFLGSLAFVLLHSIRLCELPKSLANCLMCGAGRDNLFYEKTTWKGLCFWIFGLASS